MATSRRPSRPGRPASASARRRPVREEEIPEGEEGEIDEAPPPKSQNPSVTTMVGLGAALLFAILLLVLMLSKRDFLLEVENLSPDPMQNVTVKINGEEHKIGDLRPNSVDGVRVKPSPGNDVVVFYNLPNRGRFERRLPKVDKEGKPLELDFTEYKGRCRILLKPEGIDEVNY